jgi:hypothetical protein
LITSLQALHGMKAPSLQAGCLEKTDKSIEKCQRF